MQRVPIGADGGTLFVRRLILGCLTALAIVSQGPKPIAAQAAPDADGDGLPDAWEQAYGLDPQSTASPNGADDDPDRDGASNLAELTVQLHGTMLRRAKEEVLSLPPKLRTWLPTRVPAGTGTREIRDVVTLLLSRRAGASVSTDERSRIRLLALLTKARQKLAVSKVDTTLDLARGAVDAHHFRAHVGEQHPAERARPDAAELDHPHTV